MAAAARLSGRGPFARLVAAASLVALFTISDGFVYLALQQRVDFDTGFFPLLYVATALVYMLLAVPVGVLGDRVGRVRVFLGGCLALLAVYGVLLTDLDGLGMVGLALALFGLYYAATDGVLAAIASALLPADLRATGLSAVTAVSGITRLVASIVFGALWTATDVHTAVVFYAVGLTPCSPLSPYLFCDVDRRELVRSRVMIMVALASGFDRGGRDLRGFEAVDARDGDGATRGRPSLAQRLSRPCARTSRTSSSATSRVTIRPATG